MNVNTLPAGTSLSRAQAIEVAVRAAILGRNFLVELHYEWTGEQTRTTDSVSVIRRKVAKTIKSAALGPNSFASLRMPDFVSPLWAQKS
jgi:hypothetical protein